MSKEVKFSYKKCNTIGDVCFIGSFEATMVDVERKVFEIVAWCLKCDDTKPFKTKIEALRIAKEEMVGDPMDNVMKARFRKCFSIGKPCWEMVSESTTEEPTTEEKGIINSTIWNNINDLENALRCVVDLASEMAFECNFNFADAKKYLIREAEGILDKYIYGLKGVDSELAGKVETCIKNLIEEVKAINNHDDVEDWEVFNIFDVDDVLYDVIDLIEDAEK